MADERAKAFAPASIGNVGVGFDVLGLAIEGAGDRVIATRVSQPGIRIERILDPDGNASTLSTDAESNTASIGAKALLDAAGSPFGVVLEIEKGIPLQSGMGSSAASAVAAVVAVNALLDKPFQQEELLEFAIVGEAFASRGRHADNVAPSLFGGLILCPPGLHPRVKAINVPDNVCSVLLHPDLLVNTAESRMGLAASIPRALWVEQQAYLAAFIAACESNDLDLLGASLQDIVIEPQRAPSVACFSAVKEAALKAGALGSSLSGS
jgi:homoserine kinase